MMIAMTAIITPAMMDMCSGVSMWRSNANRVPSGSKAMPHCGHLPGPDARTLRCIGQT
jgi:hypothetical protein